MESRHRQAEETRIRRALDINSFDLATLEHALMEKGYVPDSTDEQAARDAVFRLRKGYKIIGWTASYPLGPELASLFTARLHDANRVETESVKYEAVRDLIRMLAIRKAQASVSQEDSRGSDAEVKEEGA